MEFLNGLGKRFSQAARTVQERTKEGVENTRLAADLKSARSELDKRLAELGRAYYESVCGGAGEVDPALIAGVRSAMDQIDALLVLRDAIRRQSRCPNCGSVQSMDARFCSGCGRPMPEKGPELPAETPEDAEYCDECGAMRKGKAKYCEICGHGFGEHALAPEPPRPITVNTPLEEPESYEEE